MTSQLEKVQKIIRYLENELWTQNEVLHAEGDTNREHIVRKPATLAVEERIFQISENKTRDEMKEVCGEEIGIGATAGNQTTPAGARKKPDSAEVASEGKDEHRPIHWTGWQKMTRGKQMPDQSQTRVIAKPCPTAVYFRNVRWRCNWKIGESVRECVPTSALLCISFCGGSALEIVTDYKLNERLLPPQSHEHNERRKTLTCLEMQEKKKEMKGSTWKEKK